MNGRYTKLLEAAEVFDSWRVVPRLIVFVYLTVFCWAIVYFSVMYFHLPLEHRTVALTAFVTTVLTAMTTAFPFIVKIYTDNGRDWDAARRPAVIVSQQNNAAA